jgi:predicted nucleic acid-binding protein
VDASVAVKWFNAEEFSDQAIALRDAHVSGEIVLAAPSLLMWEVCNALRHSPDFGSNDVRKVLKDLWDLQIAPFEPDPGWMDVAVREAFDRGVTVYDSSYLALALHLRVPFYTADRALLSKIKQGWARHISSYGE